MAKSPEVLEAAVRKLALQQSVIEYRAAFDATKDARVAFDHALAFVAEVISVLEGYDADNLPDDITEVLTAQLNAELDKLYISPGSTEA